MPVLPTLHLVKIQIGHSKKELLTDLLNALFDMHHQGSTRILEWAAYPFSRGPSWPRNRTRVSCTAGRFFTSWATREAQSKGQGARNNDSETSLSSTSDWGEITRTDCDFVMEANKKMNKYMKQWFLRHWTPDS